MNVRARVGGAARWYADSLYSALTGIGQSGRDKTVDTVYAAIELDAVQLELAYRGSWMARKIVDIPAFDMVREWRAWQAENDQIEKLEEQERILKVRLRVQQALTTARLYGGAVIVIGLEDNGATMQELDLETVSEGSLKFLHVLSRWQINAGPIIRDVMSPWFGQPEYYEQHNRPVEQGAKQVRIHPSRVVRVLGLDRPEGMGTPEAWGDPVLQVVDDAIKGAGMVTTSIAHLVQEAKFDVFKIPQLSSILGTDEGAALITERVTMANAYKSIINGILIDKEEEWERIGATFTGMPEVLQMFMVLASGAADIPATRFLGQSPVGMNATGESDLRNYYDRVRSEQALRLTPTLSQLDEVLIRHALGARDKNIWYEWNPLWQMTDKEKADIAKQKADTAKVDNDTGLIHFSALAKARQNQLIEDATYPGLEEAIAEAEAAGEVVEPPPDPLTMLQETAKAKAAAAPGGGGSVIPFGGKRKSAKDYNPYHVESGERGGQFTSGPGRGGEGEGKKKAKRESKSERAEYTPEDFQKAGIGLRGGLQNFAKEWKKHVGDLKPSDFKRDFLGGVKSTMTIYATESGFWDISGDIMPAEGDRRIGKYRREIDFNRGVAESAYFKLFNDKGSGIGKQLLAGNVEFYKAHGIERVNVHANIDVGGYAWARYGYVPTEQSWRELRRELEGKIGGSSGGGSGITPESWDEIGESDRERIFDRWASLSYDDFHNNEIDNWRENGQALQQAKQHVADKYESAREDGTFPQWAVDALDELRGERVDNDQPNFPYDNHQLLSAIQLAAYESRGDDGRDDPEFSFDDDKLQEPVTAAPKEQLLLPGVEPEDLAKHLTEEMREDIVKRFTKAFNDEAESVANSTEPPDYLSDTAREYQEEHWDSMQEQERFDTARRHDLLPEIEPDDDDESVDTTEEETNELTEALASRDPKSLWRVADHPRGKDLLLNSDWEGVLDLNDKETMDRFEAYISRKK